MFKHAATAKAIFYIAQCKGFSFITLPAAQKTKKPGLLARAPFLIT